jgi:RNA polymerase sigma-70 factor, ECF subfamily
MRQRPQPWCVIPKECGLSGKTGERGVRCRQAPRGRKGHSQAEQGETVAFPSPTTGTVVSEPELIQAAQAGERPAQASLVQRYWDRLYRWLYHLTHDAHAAEDLTQDSFLKALANLKRFRPGSNFAAWLFRIGHNNFANYYRARNRQRESLSEDLADRGSGPVQEVLNREALRELTRAINEVPMEWRAALLLRAEEGLSFRQIAEILDLTEETARWRVFKARQKLLQALAPQPEREVS